MNVNFETHPKGLYAGDRVSLVHGGLMSLPRPPTVFHQGRHYRATGAARGDLAEYACHEGGEDRRVWAGIDGQVFAGEQDSSSCWRSCGI